MPGRRPRQTPAAPAATAETETAPDPEAEVRPGLEANITKFCEYRSWDDGEKEEYLDGLPGPVPDRLLAHLYHLDAARAEDVNALLRGKVSYTPASIKRLSDIFVEGLELYVKLHGL